MKKRHLLKTMLLLFALIVGSSSVWAEDVTLTQSSLGLTGSYTTNTEKTIDGITYVYTDLMKNNEDIQAKASSGTIYNKTAFPGDITSVAITHSGTARATTIFGSSDGTNWTQVTTGSGSITSDFSNKGYKYFKITRGSNAAYWTKIEITYAQGGSNLSPNNLALTGAPVALSFDLYNNSSAQTISYTTSSTGAVTVSENAYVTTSVNATTQTITVTPKNAVTPETQTIIVSQAADEAYAAGSVTFTVTIEDTTPFNGVIFDATQDKGTSSIVKDNVSLACTNGVLDNESEYRFYKNSVTTISTKDGSKITKIEFIGISGYPASGFASQNGWTTNGNNGTWTGNAESVSFTASGAQVRATVIKVTVEANTNPAITAENVDIAYDATGGNIAFTVNNGVEGGSISASTLDTWVSLGNQTTSPISFTCDANTVATERTATVTLTYTYNTNETVTKEVTITQAGNPNVVDNISDITEVGSSYKVRGTVVATNSRGFVIGDGTGYVYTYLNAAPTQSVGDMVTISGTTGTYGHIIQFTNTATVSEATSSNYTAGMPAAIVLTAVPDYTQGYHLSTYLKFEGTLSKDGNNYLITLGESQIQISYPSTAQGTALTALDGKTVCVKGYFSGINSNSKFTIMLESVEEVVSTEPSISLSNYNVEAPVEGKEGTITVTYNNITEVVAEVKFYEADGTTKTTYNWVTAEINDENNIEYHVVANDGAERKAYLKVYVNDVYSDLITITQAAPVNDYAELPFEFDGGSSDIESTSGLSAEGLGDYSSSPKLKFDGTDDYLLLQFNETPGTLTFDIKGNGFSGGTFTVQTSVDGVTFTDLESYTELGATQSEKFDNLAADVRYIKWIYTEKINGNVALGNIKLAKPDNTPSISVASTSAEVDADGGDGVIVVTYKNVDAEGVEVKWVESDGTTAAEYDWILADLENDNNLYYVVTPNDGAERKAYLKLCFDAETNEVCSDLITITQAAYEAPFEGATYTLASTITPGKHYIIASEADDEGNAYAMGGQTPNNRAAVAIKVDGDKAQVNSADVREFVISIPADDGLYAIFDETEGGYLYAASSGSNYLKTEETLDDNGKWTIAFNDEGDATIKAQGTNTRNWMRFNESSTLFSCYASGQADVYLYEKDEDKTTVVTISELGYATFGSAEAVDFSKTNLTVYTAKVNDTNSEVELTEVSSKTVPAGEAVLLKGAAGTYTGKVIESTDRLTDNDLKLATADLTGNGKIYVLNKVDDKVGFYKLSAEGTLSKGKAYLESESAAPFLGFDGEDTTGINSVERGTLSVEGCYTLDGRRVAQPTKGLYIVNGKKVVIK